MKNLLRSKKFKQNLSRWLFMYVGVMSLLAMVITYSKYITGFVSHQDTTRISKFEVAIDYTDADGNICTSDCNTGTYRPTSKIKYYFKVSTDFEVKANLYLTVRIADEIKNGEKTKFKIVSIRKIREGNTIIPENEGLITVEDISKTLTIPVNVEKVNGESKIKNINSYYEVVVQYDGTIDKETTFEPTNIAVDYSAMQDNS